MKNNVKKMYIVYRRISDNNLQSKDLKILHYIKKIYNVIRNGYPEIEVIVGSNEDYISAGINVDIVFSNGQLKELTDTSDVGLSVRCYLTTI